MTPAGAYTPGTPSGVYTPGTPSENPYGIVAKDTWHAAGVCVQTVDGPEGVILEVTDEDECRVRLTTGEESVFQKQSLAIVHPSKRDETVSPLSMSPPSIRLALPAFLICVPRWCTPVQTFT
jgi:hypothetical protein